MADTTRRNSPTERRSLQLHHGSVSLIPPETAKSTLGFIPFVWTPINTLKQARCGTFSGFDKLVFVQRFL